VNNFVVREVSRSLIRIRNKRKRKAESTKKIKKQQTNLKHGRRIDYLQQINVWMDDMYGSSYSFMHLGFSTFWKIGLNRTKNNNQYFI